MATRDFKSAGQTITARRFQRDVNEIPIGIKTPIELGRDHGGIFKMHTSLADQVADNLRNLIMTNHGERLGFYGFGANLQELTMERGHDSFEIDAISRIREAVVKYMPYVDLKTFDSTAVTDRSTGLVHVRITVTYSAPTLGVMAGQIEVVLYVAG